jgi:hypothetical protein
MLPASEELNMPDPYDQVRRELERARRAFERQLIQAERAIERAAAHFHSRGPEGRSTFESRLGPRRERGGRLRWYWPLGGSGPNRKPDDPGASLMPAPVEPDSPSHLSGGAEAPLDP